MRRTARSVWMVLTGLVLTALIAVSAPGSPADKGSSSTETEIGTGILNPHSDLVFRATGARQCADCHRADGRGGLTVRDAPAVRALIAKGKGAHGPGRFADCFRCHAGGRQGLEHD